MFKWNLSGVFGKRPPVGGGTDATGATAVFLVVLARRVHAKAVLTFPLRLLRPLGRS
jgi:hypothetical protein